SDVCSSDLRERSAGSMPALGTSKTASISNRSGFSVTGTNVPPKVPPKFGTGKFFRNMGTQPKYKEPEIVRAKRGWFIALAYLRPDGPGYKRFELSGGINYIKDLDQREKEIKAMLKYLKKELETGFDPLLPDLEAQYREQITNKKESIILAENETTGWNILTAFDHFINDCKSRNLAPKTISTYESFINNLRLWIQTSEKEN